MLSGQLWSTYIVLQFCFQVELTIHYKLSGEAFGTVREEETKLSAVEPRGDASTDEFEVHLKSVEQ